MNIFEPTFLLKEMHEENRSWIFLMNSYARVLCYDIDFLVKKKKKRT